MAGRRRNIPSIERVAPQLTRRTEIIRRNARNGGGLPSFIQAKQLRMRPHISTIVSDINRYVAHDANAVTTTPISYLLPLPKELELCKSVILQLGRQFVPPFRQHSGISVTYSRIPMDPRCAVADFLACHEERV